MNVQPLPEIAPATAARAGLGFPALVFAGRGIEANLARPVEIGGDLFHNVLFGLLALGAIGAARTALMGPSRWKGLVGLAIVALAGFTSPTALEIPALQRLWS